MKRYFSILTLVLAAALTLQSTILAQTELDRSQRPTLGPTPSVRLPRIQRAELPNGLHVWLVENHRLPLVACNLVVFAGSEREPLNTPGLAAFTAAMLQEGTAKRTSLQIADEIDGMGASMRVFAQTDYASASLECLSRHLDAALDVYADVLMHAAFPETEFARVKNDRLTSILQQKDRPQAIASVAFSRVLYGANHPYGNDISGTEQSVRTATREDLVKFYQTYYHPNNATLIVYGDASLGSLLPKLTQKFGGWQKADIPAVPAFPDPAQMTRKLYIVDKPGAPQSEIRIGYPALARSTPDFFAANLMNTILGGMFTSRLNSNIRERRGFSYGVRSTFQYSRLPGPFVASGGVHTAKTDSSLQEFLKEIDLMHEKGLTAAELTAAKNRAKGVFATSFEMPQQIAASLVNLVVYNLPDDYFQNYLKSVDGVTLEDAQRVAKQYLDTSKMAIVVVGDAKAIRPGIEAMNFAPIVTADVNGNEAGK
jgi:zinc protease